MVLSLSRITRTPNAKVYTDYQMYIVIRKLSQGYSVKSACYYIVRTGSMDNTHYYVPLYELKRLHIFHRKVIVPFMILEQTEDVADVVDYVLTKLDYAVTIRFSKYVSMWLNGAHNIEPSNITKLLKHINKMYIIADMLTRRAKVSKWDIEAADVTKGTRYRETRRRLIANQLTIISNLSKLLVNYM